MIRTGALLGILWPALALAAPSETPTPNPQVSSLVHSVDLLGLIGDPVTDSDWRQIARIERVLVDPGSGRATFVVVSFVDREGMFALPWNDLIIDERGRARLGSRAVANGLRFYGPGGFETSRESSTAGTYPRSSSPGLAGFRVDEGAESLLQGLVVGSVLLPEENGERRLLVIVEAGTETVRVDLGPHERLDELNIRVEPGEAIQVRGHAGPEATNATFVASAIRSDEGWVDLGSAGTLRYPPHD